MRKEMESQNRGLYRESFEHDNCGIGAIVNIKGKKTHSTVAGALSIVEQLEHRAGKDAEGKTGDGVGILTQIPHGFFKKVCQPLGIKLKDERDYGVGMFFLPQDELKRNQAKKIFEVIVKKEGLKFLGWREVPIHPDILGKTAVDCMPCIMQAFIERPAKYEKGIDFDRRLYVVRRIFEQSSDDTYVVSLSSRTIVYKGMFLVGQLRLFFEDLQDEEFISAIAMVHSRFSTNTAPSWQRAHPNRFMVHNGEINTIRGNADKMRAREETMEAGCLKGELHKVLPAINTSGSDSAMLDNALEFMVMSGMDLPLAVMICIPEPWINNKEMSQNKKDFYQYYATMMEPWDGPASILFSDGDVMGAVLDRNGLRPSRYYITDDDNLILSSEVGVLDIDPSKIVMKERLHPGKMLLVDTVAGRVIDDEELKEKYANQFPYGEWLDSNLIQLKDLKIPNKDVPKYTAEECTQLQKAFGYSYEDVKTSILTMAKNGAEGTAAMGMDAPISVLSQKRQPLFGYFKQLFAQVTNPPIDAIREEVVTSTTIYVGTDGNLLEQKEENCKMLRVNNPILTNTDMMKIKSFKHEGFKTAVVSTLYYKSTKLERAIDRLFVDESHTYKNLFLYTKMSNVAGVQTTDAKKSSDMFNKCQYISEITGNKGITFATGTPISNSMTELYTNMRYLQYDTLQDMGLGHFDSWAAIYGETKTVVELAPEGTGYITRTRFSRFYNLPELIALFKEVADIRTAEMLNLPRPKADYENVQLKPSEIQKTLVADLAERAEAIRNGSVDPSEDNMLSITNDGRKLALDQRLFEDIYPDDKNSKINSLIQRAIPIWQETKAQKGVQLIFCDMSTPKKDGSFNVYDDIRDKLIAEGVPADEIAYIHDANTIARKNKLFAKVRKGTVRFLLGSTAKMGAGTNVQDRLIALHHLDVPWRPSDIEQREGRILREGNKFGKVKIFRYVTENTFDSYNWQILENKQKFISQIMTSKSPVRTADDIDELVLTFSEVKALATGNPFIKEKMELDVEVARLKLYKGDFNSQKYRLEDDINFNLPQRIKHLELMIDSYEKDIQTYQEHYEMSDEFTITINHVDYTSRKEAGAALAEQLHNLPPKTIGEAENFLIGKYLRFDLMFHREPYDKYLILKGELNHIIRFTNTIQGTIMRLQDAPNDFKENLDEYIERLSYNQTQLANAMEEVKKPFPKEEELKEKQARLNELNAQLNISGKNTNLAAG